MSKPGSPARLRLFGLPLDPLTMAETVRQVEDQLASGRPGAHLGVNASNIIGARADPAYAADLAAADLVGPDGQSVVWAGRLLGQRIPERVTGIDLMDELVELSARHGWRVYLLGARPAVIEAVAERFQERGVAIAGFRDGYFAPHEDERIAREIAALEPHLLFVGLPSPRKERFIIGAARPAGIPYSVGVGGSFDVIAGRVRRAPRLVQRMGMEWLYRLAQEPRRLFVRYAVTNVRFLSLVGRELAAQAVARRRRQ